MCCIITGVVTAVVVFFLREKKIVTYKGLKSVFRKGGGAVLPGKGL